MNLPKPIMKTTELKELGFPDKLLRDIREEKGQTIASQFKPNGAIYWDTEKLKTYIEKNAVRA